MGRYRKDEKVNKLLENFYMAQKEFNNDRDFKNIYIVQIYCDYECVENRVITVIHFYFHNLKMKQYMEMTLKEDDFIKCKLWDDKTCRFILNQMFVNVKLLCGWFE